MKVNSKSWTRSVRVKCIRVVSVFKQYVVCEMIVEAKFMTCKQLKNIELDIR